MQWFKKWSASGPDGAAQSAADVKFSDILTAAAVKVNMEAVDKEEALEELVDLLVQTGGVKDREAALAALQAREKLGSTGIGDGVAIPHAKHAAVEHLVAAIGTSARGIDFEAADGQPAHVVFLLLARADEPGRHVHALAQIAQLLNIANFTKRLVAARNATEVIDMIRAEE